MLSLTFEIMAVRRQGISNEAKAILDAVVNAKSLTDLTAAKTDLETHLAPLLKIRDGKESNDSVTSLSSRYGGLLIELLKYTDLSLSRPLEPEPLRIHSDLTDTALSCLHIIRSALKGRFFEVEVQRYAFLRRLFAQRCYHESAKEAEIIFESMRTSWGLKSSCTTKAGESVSLLPLPDKRQNSDSVALGVGVGIHLIICILECTEPAKVCVQLKGLMKSLAPWFR